MMNYDVRFLVGWMLGQGYYMRFFAGKSWRAALRWSGVGLAIGIPLTLGLTWLFNRVVESLVVAVVR